MTLENIIEEGKAIRALIEFIPSRYYRSFKAYKITDGPRYEKWKNLVIRFLSASYPGDRCITDFEEKIELFQTKYFSLAVFDDILGLLESCMEIPQLPVIKNASTIDKSVHVNVNQNQTQVQEQKQVVEIFLEAIKDELTGKQFKELKEIAKQEPNPEKAKTKVLDKIKSWSGDVLANVVANIVTNPTVWGGLLG